MEKEKKALMDDLEETILRSEAGYNSLSKKLNELLVSKKPRRWGWNNFIEFYDMFEIDKMAVKANWLKFKRKLKEDLTTRSTDDFEEIKLRSKAEWLIYENNVMNALSDNNMTVYNNTTTNPRFYTAMGIVGSFSILCIWIIFS